MKTNTALIIIILILALAGYFLFSSNNLILGKSILTNEKVQVVKISVEGSKYILTPSEVKIGIPVKIEADMTKMPGCSKSIVISSFNIRKTLTSQDNTIEFTPDKAGTFNIACSMNMYRGTFTVLEADGSKSKNTEQTPSSTSTGASCGMASGGGCGCGGMR
jgi:plastocyanin domain-containing protein